MCTLRHWHVSTLFGFVLLFVTGCPEPNLVNIDHRRDEVLPRYFVDTVLEELCAIPLNVGTPGDAVGLAVSDGWSPTRTV